MTEQARVLWGLRGTDGIVRGALYGDRAEEMIRDSARAEETVVKSTDGCQTWSPA